MVTLSNEEVKRIIADVPPDLGFWICSGHVVRNLYELLDNMQHMSQDTFIYHVNDIKNDFERWVREVVKDYDLAFQFAKTRARDKMVWILESRIEYLERLSHKYSVRQQEKAIERLPQEHPESVQIKVVPSYDHKEPVHKESSLLEFRSILTWGSLGLSVGIIIGFFLGKL